MPDKVWRVSQIYGVLDAVRDPGFGLAASQVPRDVPLIAVLRVDSLTSLQAILEEAFAITIPFSAVKLPKEGLIFVIAELLAKEERLDPNGYLAEPRPDQHTTELIERLRRDFQEGNSPLGLPQAGPAYQTCSTARTLRSTAWRM